MKTRIASVALMAAALLPACADDSWVSRPEPARTPAPVAFSDATTVPPAASFDLAPGMQTQLAAAEAALGRWRGGAHTTYRLVVEWDCLCEDALPALLVSAEEDTVTSALEFGPVEAAIEDGLVTLSSGETIEGPTVEWIFDEIFDALAAGQQVEATYDPANGVPISVDFDTTSPGPQLRTSNVTDIAAGRAELIEAQTLWDATGITDYRWTYGVVTLDGPGEVTAFVSNGVGEGGLSVERVYALIAEAHVNPDQTVSATFDAEMGLPLQVVIERPMNATNLPFTYTGVTSVEPTR